MSNPFPETAESALEGAGVDSSFYTICTYLHFPQYHRIIYAYVSDFCIQNWR